MDKEWITGSATCPVFVVRHRRYVASVERHLALSRCISSID
jgi:hypothetical protein